MSIFSIYYTIVCIDCTVICWIHSDLANLVASVNVWRGFILPLISSEKKMRKMRREHCLSEFGSSNVSDNRTLATTDATSTASCIPCTLAAVKATQTWILPFRQWFSKMCFGLQVMRDGLSNSRWAAVSMMFQFVAIWLELFLWRVGVGLSQYDVWRACF